MLNNFISNNNTDFKKNLPLLEKNGTPKSMTKEKLKVSSVKN